MAFEYFAQDGIRMKWSIEDYVEELIYLNHISEFENVDNRIVELKREMKIKYPKKSRKYFGFVS